VRNGGGRTTDAIRSILDLDALGAMGTIVVIHHTGMYSFNYIYQERQSSWQGVTDCGMTYLTEKEFSDRTEEKHPDFAGTHPGFDYGAIHEYEYWILRLKALLTAISPEKTVVADVEYLKSFPSLAEKMTIAGLVLDTFTGELKRLI
jgi:carbonic anhydrase